MWLRGVGRFVVLILFPAIALPADFPNTDAEFARLPPYCAARSRAEPGSEQWEFWARKLGKGFIHIHHYCAGMNGEYKADLYIDPKKREGPYRASLVGGDEYMEDKAGYDFVLMPEILVRKGKLLLKLGEPQKAMEAFRKAKDINPRYSWSYMAIADFYRERGLDGKAKEVVEEGLANVPESQAKGLKRRLADLSDVSKPSLAPEAATETESKEE